MVDCFIFSAGSPPGNTPTPVGTCRYDSSLGNSSNNCFSDVIFIECKVINCESFWLSSCFC